VAGQQQPRKDTVLSVGAIPELVNLRAEVLRSAGYEVISTTSGLVPEWHEQRKASIVFSYRGCIRTCSFCAVPKLEGKPFKARSTTRIRHLVHSDHMRVILWDNNILGEAHWRDVVAELKEMQVEVDFNQGLDARLINDESSRALAEINLPTLRLAYDFVNMHDAMERCVLTLKKALTRSRYSHICCYVLYNYKDTPDDLFKRVRDLLAWVWPRIRCVISH
jgi:hypothetical protein